MSPIKKIYFLSAAILFSIFSSTSPFNITKAHTQDSTPATRSEKEINLQKIAGLYWKNHTIGFAPFVKENEANVTDVLEIVPYDNQSAYIRTHLYFTNGHMCTFHGIAKKESDRLSYYDSTTGKSCIMDLETSETTVTIIDRSGQCRFISCGARGGFGAVFSATKKRPITYMKKLESSPQYQEAVAYYKKRLEAEKAGIKPEWVDARNNLAHYASAGNIDGVRESLSQGANPNSIKEKGRTLVNALGYDRNIEITKLLLDKGLDINTIQKGETLLTSAAYHRVGISHKTAIQKTLEYIKWLLENGADVNFINDRGEKALDIAKRTRADQSIIDLLNDKARE